MALGLHESQEDRFTAHDDRAAVLNEVHARPFMPIATPARLLQFGFLTSPSQSDDDRNWLSRFCETRGREEVPVEARHHRTQLDGCSLRWERHNEFTTYCWYFQPEEGDDMSCEPSRLHARMADVRQPGPHLVSIDMHIVDKANAPDFEGVFARESLCVMTAEKGEVVVATDFKADAYGFVRILVVNNGINPMRMGALAQRLLELETYRLLALLCLPEAHRLEPSVRRIEQDLVAATQAMTQADTLEDNERLLEQLVMLAAKLEAGAARALYRFGASRAYQNIVLGRIAAINLEAVPDRESFTTFLNRRMAPALQTCFSIEERQINLSRKLARATQLLRAKVDVAIERQNRDILQTVSERAQLQLRLQQTVEGLSIAAVSYYVVGLLGYILKGLGHSVFHFNAELALAFLIPFTVAAVAMVVRTRTKHVHHALVNERIQ